VALDRSCRQALEPCSQNDRSECSRLRSARPSGSRFPVDAWPGSRRVAFSLRFGLLESSAGRGWPPYSRPFLVVLHPLLRHSHRLRVHRAQSTDRSQVPAENHLHPRLTRLVCLDVSRDSLRAPVISVRNPASNHSSTARRERELRQSAPKPRARSSRAPQGPLTHSRADTTARRPPTKPAESARARVRPFCRCTF
jgi:hypothetical protein